MLDVVSAGCVRAAVVGSTAKCIGSLLKCELGSSCAVTLQT